MTRLRTTRSKGLRAAQILVDVCLAFVLVLVQATALADETPHEWLGIASFVLVIVHFMLSRKRICALIRGRKSVGNVVQLLIDALLVVTILGQIASSVVLSEHAFSWLPVIPGAFWARTTHLLCGYWSFVLAFVHTGIHVRHLPRAIKQNALTTWMVRIVIAVLTIAGIYLFFSTGIPTYLFLQLQFPFVDFSVPLWLRFFQWACIGIAFSTVTVTLMLAARQTKVEKSATS